MLEIQTALRIMRHTVETAATAAAVLERAAETHPDLVLIDLGLPGEMSSAQVARQLHTQLDVPVVYLSSSEDTVTQAQAADPFGYIFKPFASRALEATVQMALYKHQMERRLKDSEQQLAAILRCATEAVIATDAATAVTYVNPAAEALLGCMRDVAIGQPLAEIIRIVDEKTGDAIDVAEVHRDEAALAAEMARHPVLIRPDGCEIPVDHRSGPILDHNGAQVGTVVVLQDVTDRRQAQKELEYRALYDSLTDLANRTLLRERLQHAIVAARRPNITVGLLLLDLDRFKEVNDTFGHHVGDTVLQQVAQRLRLALRPEDTIARLGGDEFAVVLLNADERRSTVVALKLLRVLEQSLMVEGQSLDMRASIGIAICPDHGDDPDTLLRRADVAMYVAKRRGGGYAVYAAEQDEHSPTRLALMNELRRAIEQHELTLYYQPKLHLRTRRVTGVEALVRWQHPRMGLLQPDQFIGLAEYTGLISTLSVWVLDAALRQCRTWLDAKRAVPVAINLSMRNLQDQQLPETIGRLLEQWGVPPSYLAVEITESAVMAEPARAMVTMTNLRAMDIRIAVDDFGTGYSSLSYLKRLPLHYLKIDRSFVKDLRHDENDAAIVRSIIDLSRNLGLGVIAEGVEDRATWDILMALGCHEAQGYYVSRPLPVEELESWLATVQSQASETAETPFLS